MAKKLSAAHRRESAEKKAAALGDAIETMCRIIISETRLNEPSGNAGISFERRRRGDQLEELVGKLQRYLEHCTEPEQPSWVERIRATLAAYATVRADQKKKLREEIHALGEHLFDLEGADAGGTK